MESRPWGGDVNLSTSTQVAQFGGGGGGGPGLEYTGPGSGGGSGGISYGGDYVMLTFYIQYSDYATVNQGMQSSINEGMLPEQTKRKKEADSKKENNWIEKTIAIGSTIGLIPIPVTQGIGPAFLVADGIYSTYKFYKGGSGWQLMADLSWLAVPRILRKGARTIGVKHYRAIRGEIHEYAETVEVLTYSGELHRNAYVVGKD